MTTTRMIRPRSNSSRVNKKWLTDSCLLKEDRRSDAYAVLKAQVVVSDSCAVPHMISSAAVRKKGKILPQLLLLLLLAIRSHV